MDLAIQTVQHPTVKQGLMVSCDIHQFRDIPGVHQVTGDIRDDSVQKKIKSLSAEFDLIISDVHPGRTSTPSQMRQAQNKLIIELIQICNTFLSDQATFLTKGLDPSSKRFFLKHFSTVNIIKPKSSRKESDEIFFLCRGFLK